LDAIDMKQITITVGIPSAGHPKIEFVNSIFALISSGLIHNVVMVPRLPIQQARTCIAQKLNTTHLLFIDDDMVFTPEDVKLLIDANKDFVCGLYMRRSVNSTPICYEYRDGDFYCSKPPEKLSRGIGSLAFTLIKKEVIDKVGHEFRFSDKGEDMEYVERIIKAGFDTWIEPNARIGHLMEVAL